MMDTLHLDNAKEYSLLLIKPDGYQRGLVGEVIRRIEQKGYSLAALRMCRADKDLLAHHYADLIGQPFYDGVVTYMMSGPIVALVCEGKNVIEGLRNLIGVTNPTKAAPGTIRGDFAREWDHPWIANIVHASDCLASAQREIPLWFPLEEK